MQVSQTTALDRSVTPSGGQTNRRQVGFIVTIVLFIYY